MTQVCFTLETPQGDFKEYAVKLEEVSGATRFEDQYDFGVPNVTVKLSSLELPYVTLVVVTH